MDRKTKLAQYNQERIAKARQAAQARADYVTFLRQSTTAWLKNAEQERRTQAAADDRNRRAELQLLRAQKSPHRLPDAPLKAAAPAPVAPKVVAPVAVPIAAQIAVVARPAEVPAAAPAQPPRTMFKDSGGGQLRAGLLMLLPDPESAEPAKPAVVAAVRPAAVAAVAVAAVRPAALPAVALPAAPAAESLEIQFVARLPKTPPNLPAAPARSPSTRSSRRRARTPAPAAPGRSAPPVGNMNQFAAEMGEAVSLELASTDPAVPALPASRALLWSAAESAAQPATATPPPGLPAPAPAPPVLPALLPKAGPVGDSQPLEFIARLPQIALASSAAAGKVR